MRDYNTDKYNCAKNKGKCNDENHRLPTFQEYTATHLPYYGQLSMWSEPKYLCPKCEEGGMCRNEMIVLASYPPQYEYSCDKCGYIEYQNG